MKINVKIKETFVIKLSLIKDHVFLCEDLDQFNRIWPVLEKRSNNSTSVKNDYKEWCKTLIEMGESLKIGFTVGGNQCAFAGFKAEDEVEGFSTFEMSDLKDKIVVYED